MFPQSLKVVILIFLSHCPTAPRDRMKTGRQPPSPTRGTAYTHASPFILQTTSLTHPVSVKVFLGGMEQEN